MMDFLNELSRIADLELSQRAGAESQGDKIIQWQALFGCTYENASRIIAERYSDFDRKTISMDLWNDIKGDWISRGYDKDAYEYHLELELKASTTIICTQPHAELDDTKLKYLMRLEGELSDSNKVADILGIVKPPATTCDAEDPLMRFCYLTDAQRRRIENHIIPKPTFISLGALPSNKDLDAHSQHPTLGIESMLPQHRACTSSTVFEPKQDEYPVWYFFYGNLAKQEILGRRLGVPEKQLKYIPARIYGGRLATWRNKYRALQDGVPSDFVDGSGFVVESKDIEDWLRAYETEAYEVVRCRMELDDGKVVPACTFRFTLIDEIT